MEASVAVATGAWGGKLGGNALTTSGRARSLRLQNEGGTWQRDGVSLATKGISLGDNGKFAGRRTAFREEFGG